jgi:drug/metabolite transporter (DMT)-like permease
MPPRLAAFLAIALWGISFVATKIALAEVAPVALVVTRFAMGALLLHCLLAARGESLLPPRESVGALVVMGFFGVFVHQLLQANALRMTSAVSTGWLIGLTPIWSAVLAAVFLHERFGAMKVAGLVLGFAGTLLVVTRGELGVLASFGHAQVGDLLIVASTVNWAVYTVVGHATIRRLGALRATAGMMLAGTLLLLPIFLWQRAWHDWSLLSAKGWAAVLFLGIGCSGAGYLLWYSALAKIGPTRVAAFLYIEPLVTLAAAMALIGERAGVATIVGGATVLAGVALVQRGEPHVTPRVEHHDDLRRSLDGSDRTG